jgi:hypothetical protein
MALTCHGALAIGRGRAALTNCRIAFPGNEG